MKLHRYSNCTNLLAASSNSSEPPILVHVSPLCVGWLVQTSFISLPRESYKHINKKFRFTTNWQIVILSINNLLTVWSSISCDHTQIDHSWSTLQFKVSVSPENISFDNFIAFRHQNTFSDGNFFLFRYCCPLKSLNVLRIIANKLN